MMQCPPGVPLRCRLEIFISAGDRPGGMIDGIEGMTVMVSDQQKAVEFYTQRLGLEKKVDTDAAGYRWVVVGPRGSETVISLADPAQLKDCDPEQIERARARIGAPTGIWFYTKDIEATYQELRSRQVDITKPERQAWGGVMSRIHDQDRNTIWLVGDSKE